MIATFGGSHGPIRFANGGAVEPCWRRPSLSRDSVLRSREGLRGPAAGRARRAYGPAMSRASRRDLRHMLTATRLRYSSTRPFGLPVCHVSLLRPSFPAAPSGRTSSAPKRAAPKSRNPTIKAGEPCKTPTNTARPKIPGALPPVPRSSPKSRAFKATKGEL